MSQFNAPHFQNHGDVRKYLEGLRWAASAFIRRQVRRKRVYKDFSITTKSVRGSSHVMFNV